MRLFVTALVCAIAFGSVPTYATEDSLWRSGQDFTVDTIDGDMSSAYQPCQWSFASVIDNNGVAQQRYGCLETGGNLSLFTYYDNTITHHQLFGIKIGNDASYRQIEDYTSHTNSMRLLPETDTILVQNTTNPTATKPKLELYRLADSPFIANKMTNGIGVLHYKLDASKAVPLFGVDLDRDGTMEHQTVVNFVLSNNRQYMAAWINYNLVVVVNLETLQTRAVTALLGAWYGIYPSPAAISDDGRYVFIQLNGHMYDTIGCGENYDYDFLSNNSRFTSPCDMSNLYDLIGDIDGITRNHHQYRFIEDDTALEFIHPYTGPTKTTTIATEAYDPQRLEYLALGDSYSSGEGDTETIGDTSVKWYRPGTDIDGSNTQPQEKCHVSLRSYPYLLAEKMNLGYNTQWQTVACSGATAWDVKEQGSSDYLGQNSRLEGYDALSLKTTALNEFIPGRQKQIEFVKKYRPKAITLTMGGNDVDFGGKLVTCALWQPTCEFAKYSWRTSMKNELREQFSNLSNLYEELATASPGTKIYVLGYPQFINADPNASCTNTFNLNDEERELVVNSIIYLNNVIEAAATSAGVTYVDTEGALGGHRICDEEDKHMTAITNPLGWNGNERQESFHPNNLGHEDIANDLSTKLGGSSLMNHVTCPNGEATCQNSTITADSAKVPPYFNVTSAGDDSLAMYYKLTNGTLVKSQGSYHIWTGKTTFGPGTKVDITLYSDPTPIGEYTAADNGSLDAVFEIPDNIPAGYHTIVARGLSYSGEPIMLYQTVEVHGPSSDDIDEDGINDSRDSCIFFSGSEGTCPVRTIEGDLTVGNNGNSIDRSSATAVMAEGSDITTATFQPRDDHDTPTGKLGNSILLFEPNPEITAAVLATDTSSQQSYPWQQIGGLLASSGIAYMLARKAILKIWRKNV